MDNEGKCPDVYIFPGDYNLKQLKEEIEYYKKPFTQGNTDAKNRMKNRWACGSIIPGSAAKNFKKQKTKMYNELIEHLKTFKNNPNQIGANNKKLNYSQCNWDNFANKHPLKGGKRRKSRKKRRKSKKKKSRRKRRSRRRRRRR